MALIVFYRHGKAEPRREGVSDRERRLTREGVMQVECGGRLLLGAGFKKIYRPPTEGL
ncbi:hypothetical protein [Aeropyrum camini]|uniref:hypothetical protein n=1 Tax=Aeropyrum camini TaxID=229980 RepID=UPI0012E328F0|nr:hypothetical protein [Aeropyrum camini]